MVPAFEWQCLTCGATVDADRAPAPGEQRECVQCHLYGRPRFPFWRWRRVEPGTPAEQLAVLRYGNALLRAVRAQYGGRRA